jgi:hypothetical protein
MPRRNSRSRHQIDAQRRAGELILRHPNHVINVSRNQKPGKGSHAIF